MMLDKVFIVQYGYHYIEESHIHTEAFRERSYAQSIADDYERLGYDWAEVEEFEVK